MTKLFYFAVIVAAAGSFMNCQSEANNNGLPPIMLLGQQIDTAYLNTQYRGPNPPAIIEIEGSRREDIKVTGSVNTTVPGTYYLDYDYTDVAGNRAATVTRTVHVVLTRHDTFLLNQTYSLFKKINVQKHWIQGGKKPKQIDVKTSSEPLIYLEYRDGDALQIYNVFEVYQSPEHIDIHTTTHFGDTLCIWSAKQINAAQVVWTMENPVKKINKNLGSFTATD